MYAGAHVAPENVRPTTRRLYEFTVGAASAVSGGPCPLSPPRDWYASGERPSLRLSDLSFNRLSVFLSASEICMCMPLPVRFDIGLGMNEQTAPSSCAISLAAMRSAIRRSAVFKP